MNEKERYKILDMYNAAIYYKHRNPAKFQERFGMSIDQYRTTTECREAHELVRRFK